MKKAVQTLVALAMLSIPLAASAQEPHRPAPPQPVTHYTFDDHPVPGRDYAPSDHPLFVRTRRDHGSLIRIRDQFVDEMRKSVERL